MLVDRMSLLKQAPSSSNAQLKQRVRRLAPYRPFGPGEGKVEFVRRQLVLAAAFEEEHGFASLAECRDSCIALWGVEIEIDELIPTMKALTAEGRMTRAGGRYALTEGARAQVAAVAEGSAAIEAAALAHWETALAALGAKLDGDDISTLRADLLTWLHRIIAHYGMEAAVMLYPEQERAQRFFDEVAELGFQFLPNRNEALAAVRPTALYLFIREPSTAARAFIANLMTTGYMVAVFTLDPAAEQLVQAVTAGQRLYLDTNVLYSALNLNGPRAYLSTQRALDLSRKLGYELAVTPWTIAEMKESVRGCRHELAKNALPPRALADIAANAAGEGSFVAAYWRKYRETGVTPQDFCDFHEQVETLLEKMDIKIIDEGCAEVDEDRGAIEEQIAAIERIWGSEKKTESAKVHDAKHRLLIDRLRGDRKRERFSEAGCWFVTRDGVLIPYGMAERAPGAVPFAASLTAWAQIVRGFTARTEDYDQTLIDFLDTPALRPRGVNMVSPETISETLGRIDFLVQDSTEEVATRVMLDSAKLVEIEKASSEERTAKINAVIEEKSRELEQQLQQAQAQLDAERAARTAAEARAENIGAEFERARRQHEDADRAARDREAAEREEAEKQIAEADARTQRAERGQQNAARAHTEEVAGIRRRERILRGVLGSIFGIAGVAAVAVPAIVGVGGWALVLLILLGGALFGLGLAVAFNFRTAKRVLGTIVAVLTAAVTIQVIVTSLEPAHHHAAQEPKR
jgi:hypothetical protein